MRQVAAPVISQWFASDVMVLFGIGVEGDLWRKQQLSTRNGQWSEWTRMSTGKTYSRVSAVVRTNPGQPLSVVALNTAGGFDAYTETATAGVWNAAVPVTAGSTARTDIAVAALPSGVLRVFSLSTTGVAIQFTESAIGGATWTADGTVSNSGPNNTNVSATRFTDGRIALGARNAASEVWVARQAAAGSGVMSSFVQATTGSVTDIDLEAKSSGLLFIVGVGAGGIVYQRSETSLNTWAAWAALAGTGVQNITADQYANGDLFTAAGYPAAAWVNGYQQGTVTVNTQNGGVFNAAFSDVVNDRITSYAYDVRDGMTAMTDASGNVTTYGYDWMGRKLSNHDPDMSNTTTSATTYTYTVNTDGTSQQTMKDPVGTQIRTKSDVLGRPILKDKMVANTATVAGTLAEWRYDNVAATTNSMGKLVSASACDGTLTTSCFGQATEIRNTITGYDTRGRTTAKQLSGNGLPATLTGPYNFAYTYDDANHVLSQTYPSQADTGGVAETVNQSYYADGRPFATLSTLGTYVGATNYYSTGLIATRFLGVNSADNKGAQRWFTYDDRYRVQSLIGRRNTNTAVDGIQQDTYSYDPANQVTSINHGETGGTDQGTECFRYDQRNRLSNAWTTTVSAACTFNATGFNNYTTTTGAVTKTGTIYGAGAAIASTAPYNKTYAYDPTGNISYQGSPSLQAGGGIEPGGYTYPAQSATSVLPHAVTGTAQGVFTYNANGSMIQRAVAAGGSKQCLYWNSENRVESMTATTTAACPIATTLTAGADGDRYRYNANGQRISRTTKTGATTKSTVYLEGMAEITLTTSAAAPVTNRTKYYTSGGATVATRKDGVVSWLFADLQGGVAVSVPNSYDNTAANLTGLQRQRYLPFGQRRGTTAGAPGANDNITTTERGFLAQIEDSTGLDYLNNRYHDPTIGRFVSVDPLVTATGEAYVYGGNSPITMSDPSGLEKGANGEAHAACNNGGSCNATQWSTFDDSKWLSDYYRTGKRVGASCIELGSCTESAIVAVAGSAVVATVIVAPAAISGCLGALFLCRIVVGSAATAAVNNLNNSLTGTPTIDPTPNVERWFWSGMVEAEASEFAAARGGLTLEEFLRSRGIASPAWDSTNEEIVLFWKTVSKEWASTASGTVKVAQGGTVPVGVWATVEYPALVANPAVTKVVAVDVASGNETVLFAR